MSLPGFGRKEMIMAKQGRPKIYQSSADRTAAWRERVRENERMQDAAEWTEKWDSRYPAQAAELREFEKEISRKIADEIGYISTFEAFGWPREKFADSFPLGHHPAEETVHRVAETLYALRKDTPVWVRKVAEGIVVAGLYFPEMLGHEIVSATHKYNLEISPTYSAIYRELLGLLDARFGSNRDRNSAAIKQELAGKFVLLSEVRPEASR
jgi:hypothetical protein